MQQWRLWKEIEIPGVQATHEYLINSFKPEQGPAFQFPRIYFDQMDILTFKFVCALKQAHRGISRTLQ